MAAIDLCTYADVKLRLEAASDTRKTMLEALITDASRAILEEYEREFAPVTTAATRKKQIGLDAMGEWGALIDLAPWDLRSTSSVKLHPELGSGATTLTNGSDYTLEPLEQPDGVYTAIRLSPFLTLASDFSQRFGYAQLEIAGAWGFASVPENVKQACVETVLAWANKPVVSGLDAGQDVREFGAANIPVQRGIPGTARDFLRSFERPVFPD